MKDSNGTLACLQQMFGRIYFDHNRKFYSPADMRSRLMEEAAKIAKPVRKEDMIELTKHLPRLFAWLCSFANMVEIDISAALWEKYPRLCPYCLAKANCTCIGSPKTKYDMQRPELVEARKKTANMPLSLQEWQEAIKVIYGSINGVKSLTAVSMHLLEEIGEISLAHRRCFTDNLREEVADGAAWLLSNATKLGIDLQSLVLQRYPGRCDVCGEENCQCELL